MTAGLLERLEKKETGGMFPEDHPGRAGSGNGTGHSGQENRSSQPVSLPALVKHLQADILQADASLVEDARRGQEGRLRLRELIATVLARDNLALPRMSRDALATTIADEIAGYGPIEPFIHDEGITEIMVNGPGEIWVERKGTLELTAAGFRDREHLEELISRIVAPLGRRLDQAYPFVDARLPGGARVHAILPPLVVRGPVLTIRKFPGRRLKPTDLRTLGTWNEELAGFLQRCVQCRANILVAGATASGKTTTLNVLTSFIPDGAERIITIEDTAELALEQRHVVAMETRPPNIEGRGQVTMRHLLRNALRMRPDRIIIGETRGGEAFELLQALNTGHEGGMSTIHANSPRDALRRLENMVLTAAEGLPHQVIREQIAAALDLVIFQARLPAGQRRIVEVSVLDGELDRGQYSLHRVFGYDPRTGFGREPNVPLPERLKNKALLNGVSLNGEEHGRGMTP